jgi:hypothetical protein
MRITTVAEHDHNFPATPEGEDRRGVPAATDATRMLDKRKRRRQARHRPQQRIGDAPVQLR